MKHDPSARGSRSRLLKWLGLTDDEATGEGASESTGLVRDVTAREIWLPAKRRLLARVADFLIDHDLEVMPWTLEIAYDCVTGAKPMLAQLILERTEAGQPINIVWLEQIVREQQGESSSELLAALMTRLEGTLEDFTSATSSCALGHHRIRRGPAAARR